MSRPGRFGATGKVLCPGCQPNSRLRHYRQYIFLWRAALQITTSGALLPPDSRLSAREAVRLIAKLGGFLGRRHDGEPGITVIWRGWQRLSDLTLMWLLATEGKLVGNS